MHTQKPPRPAALCRVLVALALSIAAAPPALAFQDRGRINGTVRDAGKKPVGGANVILINQVTTQRRATTTRPDGSFSFRVPPGAYRVIVEAPGLPRFDRENLIAEPGRDLPVEIDLKEAPKEAAAAAGATDGRFVDPTEGERAPGYAGDESVESEPTGNPRIREVRDRWRITFPEYDRYGSPAGGRDIPFKRGRWYDPYNQSVIKGDYPVFGNKFFMIFSALESFGADYRRTPIPSNINSARPGSAEFFGKPEVLGTNNVLQFSIELFHGDTTFRPRNFAIKISPTFSVPNYVRTKEVGVIHVDPRRGTNRTDWHFSLEDAFAEVKIEDTNANFDFISVRAGIQPFVSDFRGFIYTDNNLGARVFGGFDNNRYQFNVAAFAQLEKDTNSNLNRFDRRQQNVYMANLFRQDFLEKGFTGQLLFAYNDDRRSVEFDRNGFLVRPALVGDARPHAVRVGYVGASTDGHLKRINLTSSYFFAFGEDERNPIAGRKQTVRAHMAAVEPSIDFDYLRFRGSFFFSSGDPNPTDGRANGFDAILDDPNFIGGQFSFWNRVGIPLTQTAVGLVQPNSIIPNLRSSKTQGQANHVNPGIFIYNGGVDVEVTQRIKAIFNANYLRFHRTESLEYLLFQNRIRHDIGWDLSVGFIYRPLLINNIQFTFGASTLIPGRGFRDIYTDSNRNCPPNVPDFCRPDGVVIDPSKPLYNVFGAVRFVF